MFRKLTKPILISICLVLVLPLFTSKLVSSQSNGQPGDIVVQTIPGPSVAQKLSDRTKTSWPWYLARGSGIIAAITLVILMLSGIGQVTGYAFRILDPLTAWASHRALGITFVLSIAVHMLSLLFDHFAPFNIWQILVPWLSDYKPVTLFGLYLGSFYVALGVLAFYGAFIVVISSLVWIEKKPYIWKLIHLVSYLLIFFVFIHALYLGTDLMHGIFRWLWIISGFVIAYASIHRLWRAKTV